MLITIYNYVNRRKY